MEPLKDVAYRLFGNAYETDTDRLFALLCATAEAYRDQLMAEDYIDPTGTLLEGLAENLASDGPPEAIK
jgi:hypothetical protein